MDDYRQQGVFPGYSVAFIEEGQVYQEIVGLKQVYPTPKKLTDSLYYDLASLTKVFVTTTLAALLVEKGLLDVEIPIQHYFPNVQSTKITVRHLLTHTSGLEGYIENKNQLPAKELVEAIAGLPVQEHFNTPKYTDTSFVLLGMIIQQITGKSVADLFDEWIREPLQLEEMSYGPLEPEKCVPTQEINGVYLQGVVHDPKARILQRECGSAGLFGTLDAVVNYVQILMNAEQELLLQQKTIESWQHDWTPNKLGKWSFGWMMDTYKEEIWLRHTGFTGTLVMWNLRTKQALVFLSNRIHTFSDTKQYNVYRDDIIKTYIAEAYERKKQNEHKNM